MYVMMSTEVVCSMSVVISVCAQNYFVILGDNRLVRFDPRSAMIPELVSDDYNKVFRVNQSVAFGVTGVLSSHDEDLQEPLLRLRNKNVASIHEVKDCLVQQVRDISFQFVRNYIVGGKLADGTFGVYDLHWDPKHQQMEETYTHVDSAMTKISLSLPGLAMSKYEHFLSRVQEALSVKRLDEALPKLCAIIGEVADCDPSVGCKETVITIT